MKDGITADVLLAIYADIRQRQSVQYQWKQDGKSMVAVVKAQGKKK